MTLPPLVEWDGQAKTWKKYVEDVFAIFYEDFIKTQPRFHECWVRCYQQPIHDGKEGGFWHCVTFDGENRKREKDRIPDLRRCERIRWPRFVIENRGADAIHIDYWTKIHTTARGSKNRHYLWLQEEYVVILEESIRPGRSTVFYLITAYLTDQKHTMERFTKERADFKTAEAVPSSKDDTASGTPCTHGA